MYSYITFSFFKKLDCCKLCLSIKFSLLVLESITIILKSVPNSCLVKCV